MGLVSKKRHLIKTITWRVIGTLDTILLSWLISGNFKIGLSVGSIEFFTKMLLYYFHERIWYSFKYGVKKNIKQ